MNAIKPYWSADLSRLKRISIEAHNMWNYQGRPRHGIYNDNRLLCKSRYKQAIRIARLSFECNLSVN